eukprot:TRINITY_DN12219_c0_g1_i4.p1 TRINITY_DN12219_c0_g1~~TRINITY_DN12219_c0_g1_i4.p1  ORF type:complete len:280 (-),score=41.55 TRINITY_DN12219_c0_g1_i4:52-891(-)
MDHPETSENEFVLSHAIGGALGSMVAMCFTYHLSWHQTIEVHTGVHVPLSCKSFLCTNTMLFTLLVVGISQFFYFGCFYWLSVMMTLPVPPSAFISSVATVVGSNPCWTVIISTQVKEFVQGGSVQFFSVAESLKVTKGLGVFCSGVMPSLLLTSFPTISLSIYTTCVSSLSIMEGFDSRGTELHSKYPGLTFALGAFANICATILTYPLMSLRIQLQTHVEKASEDPEIIEVEEKKTILQRIKRSYAGIFTKIAGTIISGGVTFLVKEQYAVYVLKAG